MARILIAEDEPRIASFVEKGLRAAGFTTVTVGDGRSAATLGRDDDFDLLVLDLGLPELDGMEVLRTIRARGERLPVVILTARSEVDATVAGFEGGADDYVTKPFSLAEVIARVGAQLRRARMDRGDGERFACDGVDFDLGRLLAKRGEAEIPLTPREGEILRYLRSRAGNVVTRDEFLLKVWMYKSAAVETRTVDNTLAALRKKIERDPADPAIVLTVRGAGYRWGGA